ncbi:type II toxin-antitoxin system RnlA family toxin [Shewanella pealeana]|uniref:Uncharacterized protein n=1 Tax=Shewanella pealeana (strain ATCC 700345 / ANG-SQ1) TaxID=398579 RepID=A8H216_SHEPA|nr:type II toxin-antitoxin system RnlA family toxin [Shewanella pealeana]ABV86603.1 conserved hypothetical protein [Shewanella pealeana ATCC 700345]
MTEARNYKNLNLVRANIEDVVNTFMDQHGFTLESIGDMPGAQNGKRVVYGQAGSLYATVDIFFNNTGTSTVQFKTGRNQLLGKRLADCLYETINPVEFESVNMVVDGFIEESISPVLLCTADETYIELQEHHREASKIVWKLISIEFQDELTVTLHTTTRLLQIQGRPLSCYRAFIFNLTELLDLQGLEKVLSRQDDSKVEIIQQEVARSYLQTVMGDSYRHLHKNVEKLLVSGLCVKLAAPQLPDYCMLLYPELRSIEGALKGKMALFGLVVGRDGFGGFFEKIPGKYQLEASHRAHFPSDVSANIVEDAYTFYNKERHGLFHMEPIVDTSRVMSDISHLMTKSKHSWEHIKKLYSIQNV